MTQCIVKVPYSSEEVAYVSDDKLSLQLKINLSLPDGVTAPSAVVGQAILYVDSADGDLKVIFGDGTIKTLATD